MAAVMAAAVLIKVTTRTPGAVGALLGVLIVVDLLFAVAAFILLRCESFLDHLWTFATHRRSPSRPLVQNVVLGFLALAIVVCEAIVALAVASALLLVVLTVCTAILAAGYALFA